MSLWDWLKAGILLLIIFLACEFAGRGIGRFLAWFGIVGQYLAWLAGGGFWLLTMKVTPYTLKGETYHSAQQTKITYDWFFAMLFGWIGTAVMLVTYPDTIHLAYNGFLSPVGILFIMVIKTAYFDRKQKKEEGETNESQ